jgi:hypothetical protein
MDARTFSRRRIMADPGIEGLTHAARLYTNENSKKARERELKTRIPYPLRHTNAQFVLGMVYERFGHVFRKVSAPISNEVGVGRRAQDDERIWISSHLL